MTTPETDELVGRLEALLAKATKRPWAVVPYGDGDGDSLVIHDARSDYRVCFMATPGTGGGYAGIKANARLIADGINALPTLLAERATLTARIAALECIATFARHHGLCGIIGGYDYCTCGLDTAHALLSGSGDTGGGDG